MVYRDAHVKVEETQEHLINKINRIELENTYRNLASRGFNGRRVARNAFSAHRLKSHLSQDTDPSITIARPTIFDRKKEM